MERQYKDSGIEWIGKIPETWEVNRFKNKFKTGKGLNITKGDLVPEGIPVVSYGQVHSKKNTGTHLDDFLIRYIPSDLTNDGLSSKVSVGDFIFADTSEDIDGCGNAVYVDREIGLFAGYHSVIAFSKNPEHSKYFAYLFLTECWRSQIRMRVTGIKVFSISQAILNETTIIIPPVADQQRIADYLDEKCGEIDSLIGLQEQMIEKLKAYKQSVITETVTKGLDPNVKLVPTGIDWIGEIPEHWGMQRLRTLGWTQNGISQSGDYFGEEYTYPFVSYSDVYKNYSIPFPRGRANSSEKDRKTYSLIEGDVLFTRTSETIEEIGFSSTCIETIPDVVYSGFLIRFRPTSNKLYKGFSKYYFRSQVHRAYFVKQMNIVTRASLGQDLLKNLVVLLPPFSEQQAIASYLDEKCAEIDRLIKLKLQKIEKLMNYKKSVIYEAVTGKKELWCNFE